MKKQNKKVSPFKGISVMLDTMARMLIVVSVLFIISTRTGTILNFYQIILVNVALAYWTIIPTINYVKEVFFNGA